MSTKMYHEKAFKKGKRKQLSRKVENRHIIINTGCQVLREQLNMPMLILNFNFRKRH